MMNRHQGIKCNYCLEENFRGHRYMCLRCYNYDLCSVCYDAEAANDLHNANHPMQCILTRADFALYYGGEASASFVQPQSYTCPICGRMGFTNSTLKVHVIADHANTLLEVICPVCATSPRSDVVFITGNLKAHFTSELEHRGDTNHQELVRRGTPRLREIDRSSTSQPAPLPRRINVRPIAELLSPITSAPRMPINTRNFNSMAELRLLQAQLEVNLRNLIIERPRCEMGRQPLPSIDGSSQIVSIGRGDNSSSRNTYRVTVQPLPSRSPTPQSSQTPNVPSNFLLPNYLEELSTQHSSDDLLLDRSQFVQQLILSTLLSSTEELLDVVKD